MKTRLPVLILVLIAIGLGAAWFFDRQRLQNEWVQVVALQVTEIAALQRDFLAHWQANQAWPAAESIPTTALRYNGSTMAGQVRIDRYVLGVDEGVRVDFVLRPGGDMSVEGRDRQ